MLPVLYMAVLFCMSHQPALPSRLPDFAASDKLMHVLAYGLLARLWWYSLRDMAFPRRWFCSLVLTMAYGILDEWHQSFVPNRSPELLDWVADSVGAWLALAPEFWRRTSDLHT